MSAWSDWKCGAITDDEYKFLARREYARDELPFYTDDADDPHWRCENCGHCKTFNARKPELHFMPYVDEKGYVHNNPDKPYSSKNYIARWSFDEVYVPANLCELTNNQVMDDDYCEDFEEREE